MTTQAAPEAEIPTSAWPHPWYVADVTMSRSSTRGSSAAGCRHRSEVPILIESGTRSRGTIIGRAAFYANDPWTAGVIGLGYIGLPLAITAADAGLRVIGYDVETAAVEVAG